MDEKPTLIIVEAENKLRQDVRKFLNRVNKSKTDHERLTRVVQNLVQVDIESQENVALAKMRLTKMLTREYRLGRTNSFRYDLNRHIAIKQALNTLQSNSHFTQSTE